MNKYICTVCATIYNPELGDPDDGIPAVTPFENLPNDWTCPVCGSVKGKYELLPDAEYERLLDKH